MNVKILQMLQVGNIIAVFPTILVNGLANILPLGGNYTGELSDNIPNLFVPTGITFAIWGIIYLLIIIFAFYLGKDLFKEERTTTSFLENVSIFFILASLANIIWIFLWHYEHILLSLFAMLFLFFSLLTIYLRLNIGIEKVSLKEKLCIHLPISVYLSWITVATIANITAVLVTINWNGFGISEVTWTIFIIIVIMIITTLMITKRKDYAYSVVIIWALIGIYLKRMADDPFYGVQIQIAYAALIAIVAIVIISSLSAFGPYVKNKYSYSK